MFDLRDLQIALMRPAREVDMGSGWTEHIPFAFFITKVHRPRLLVELGTHTGTSFCAFCQAVHSLNLPARCFAVDTWRGDQHSGIYESEVFIELSSYHNSLYSAFSSLLPMTFDEALKEFSDGTIDLLHIDGCHFYEAVKHDFESWLPKMSPRGVVILHDTCVEERGFGVRRFLDELCSRYPTFEFTHGNGLGVVGVGGELSGEPVWDILQAAPETVSDLRLFFSTIGKAQGLEAEVKALSAALAVRDKLIAQLEKSRDIETGIGRAVTKVLHKAKHGIRVVKRIYNLRYYNLLKRSDLFDADWYSNGPHSYSRKKMPLLHYLVSGAARGIDPSLRFSNDKYLESNPGVRESGINPLAHYLLHGKAEDLNKYSLWSQ